MINIVSLFLMIIGTLVGALGALAIKKGSASCKFVQCIKSKMIWLGFLLYAASIIFYVLALKNEKLSVIYPFASLTYLWVTFLSVKFLKEKMNQWKLIALFGIILGVVLIGIGS